MWESILKMGDFESVKTQKGVAVCSKDRKKRYYYKSVIPNEENKSNISLIMFNSGSIDGNDDTVKYVENVCRELCQGSFDILNLIPSVKGNPDNLLEEDSKFDPINYKIIQHVIHNASSLIWVGWGKLVQQKTSELLPPEFRKLLQDNNTRIVQIEKDKSGGGWYPWHPAYAARYKRIAPKDLKLVPFDTKILNRYPI